MEANDRIDIRKDARLIGDIKTARIVIEDGAYFKGSIDIVKPDAAKANAAAQAASGAGSSQGLPKPPAASPTPVASAVGAGATDIKR